MGQPLNPREAEKKGLVRVAYAGDRSPTLNVSSATPRRRLLKRKALALERNLLKISRVSESRLARKPSYEGKKITLPSRGFEV